MPRLTLRAVALVILLSGAAAADTLYLRGGGTVEGDVDKVEQDHLLLRTHKGLRKYTRDEVKYWAVDTSDADGKPAVKKYTFKRNPLHMPFEREGDHYIVKTDIDARVCRRAAAAMDRLYEAYADVFHVDADEKRPKAEVVVFKDKEDFLAYAEKIGGETHAGSLGFFRREATGGLICTYRRRTDEFHTMSTLYHEATHQFISMVMPPDKPPPLWLNEGVAVYFENSEWKGGKLRTGNIPAARLKFLQKKLRAGEHIPLADLIIRTRDRYDALCYSEGWSLVYFYVHARGGAYKGRFRSYFRALQAGMDPEKAFRKHLARDLGQLERAWKKHVLGLKAPSK